MKMNHWADYVIFVIFLLVSLGIGLYHALTGGRQRTTEEFIMADRKLKLIPTTLSVLMSYMSAILVVGSSAEVYAFGFIVAPMCIMGFWIAIIITERLFIPWLYPLKLTSVNRYFEMRYGNGELRAFASLVGILSAVMYMGTCMFAPAVALETATGFPTMASIPIMSVVCVIYTSMGGMRAVIWTDVFQAFVMLGGMLTVLVRGMILVNGPGRAFSILNDNDRLNIFDFSFDPHVRQTFWGYAFGWGLQWACILGLQQASVQRYSALPTLGKARLSALLNIVCIGAFVMIACLNGVAVFSYYASIPCDPILNGQMDTANQILPLFVKEIFVNAHGFSGLFLATLYSGALSSVSSSLSGAAANAWDDILRPCMPNTSEYRAAIISKLLVVLFGVISTGISFMAASMAGTVTQVAIAFFGACGGPLLGIFVLSGVRGIRFVRSRGVLVGGILGLAICLWIAICAGFVEGMYPVKPPISVSGCHNLTLVPVVDTFNTTDNVPQQLVGINKFYSMSYLWYAPLGAFITFVVGLFVSVIMNLIWKEADVPDIPDNLFIPFGQILSCRSKEYTGVPQKVDMFKEEMTTLQNSTAFKTM